MKQPSDLIPLEVHWSDMAKSSSSETRPEKIVPREYQLELLESAIEKNIIVCLGTGTGKTFISIKLIEHLARKHDIIRPFSKGAKRTFFLVNSGKENYCVF